MRTGLQSRCCLVQLFVFLYKWMMRWSLGICGEEQSRCTDLSPFVPLNYCRLLGGWNALNKNKNLARWCHLVTCCLQAYWVGTMHIVTVTVQSTQKNPNSCCVCVCLFFLNRQELIEPEKWHWNIFIPETVLVTVERQWVHILLCLPQHYYKKLFPLTVNEQTWKTHCCRQSRSSLWEYKHTECLSLTEWEWQQLKRWIMMRSKVEVVLGWLGSGKVLLEEVDESVGGGVVGVDLCGVLELRLDLFGELFAQFDSDNAEGGKESGHKQKRRDGFSVRNTWRVLSVPATITLWAFNGTSQYF